MSNAIDVQISFKSLNLYYSVKYHGAYFYFIILKLGNQHSMVANSFFQIASQYFKKSFYILNRIIIE